MAIVSVPGATFLNLPLGRLDVAAAFGWADLPFSALGFCAAAGFFFTAEVLPAAGFFAAAFGAAFFVVFFGAGFLLERAIKMSSSGLCFALVRTEGRVIKGN